MQLGIGGHHGFGGTSGSRGGERVEALSSLRPHVADGFGRRGLSTTLALAAIATAIGTVETLVAVPANVEAASVATCVPASTRDASVPARFEPPHIGVASGHDAMRTSVGAARYMRPMRASLTARARTASSSARGLE